MVIRPSLQLATTSRGSANRFSHRTSWLFTRRTAPPKVQIHLALSYRWLRTAVLVTAFLANVNNQSQHCVRLDHALSGLDHTTFQTRVKILFAACILQQIAMIIYDRKGGKVGCETRAMPIPSVQMGILRRKLGGGHAELQRQV